MSLLVISPSSDLYGANRILANILNFLQRKREIILILPDEGPFVEYLKKRDIHVKIIIIKNLPLIARSMFSLRGGINFLRNYRKGRLLIEEMKNKYDIREAYINTQASIFLVKICRVCEITPYLHVHEIIEHPSLVAKFINKKSLQWADTIIVVSNAVKNNLIKQGRSDENLSKIKLVLNGIEDPLDNVVKVNEMPINEGKIVISLIARIKPEKGIWFFLDAISALPCEVAEKCIFKIVGGEAPKGEHWVHKLNSDINQHPWRDSIKYYPFVEDVVLLQKEADILVIPSLMKDPFPTTVLEAMALGKAVIATDNGGAVEAIQNGETGYTMPPGDISFFANYLQVLIENKDLRSKMGIEGRGRYIEHFTIDIFENNFLKALNL